MEDTRRAAAAYAGDLLEKKGGEVAADAMEGVTSVHGGAGGSVAAAADLPGKDPACSDSVAPELEVMASTAKVDASSLAVQAVVVEGDALVDKKRKLGDLYDDLFGDDDDVEYLPANVVHEGNVESFIQKEVEKIKATGVPFFYNYEYSRFQCPYCRTKAKPQTGYFEHLLSHARDASKSRRESDKSRAKHAALLDALTPTP